MKQEIIQSLQTHVEVEVEEIKRCEDFLHKCEENDCPPELLIATRFCIEAQQNCLTRSEEVLKKMLEETESETEEEKE